MTHSVRLRRARAAALPLLCLVGLSLSAAAQHVLPAQGLPSPNAPPTPLSSARFGASAAGEFSGDLDVDVLVLDEGVPTLLLSPETMRTSILEEDLEGYDLATLPDGAGPGHDLALLVGPDGLHALSFDGEDGEWNEPIALATSSTWQDAFAVAVGQIDGTGGLDIAALAAGGTSVLFLEASASGYVAGTTLSLPSAATDVLLLDWNDDGDDELAVLFVPNPPPGGASGVRVYDGTSVLYSSNSPSALRGAVLHDAESGADKLGLVVRVGGYDYLKVHGYGLSEPLTSLGNAHVKRLLGWDADADDDHDLALTADTDPSVMRFPYRSASQRGPSDPILDVLDGTVVPYGDPERDPAWNDGYLATGDFDRDGHGDLFAPVQGDWTGTAGDVYSDVVFISGDPAARAAGQVIVHGGSILGSLDDPLLDLRLSITAPGWLQPVGELDVELEVTVWIANSLWGPTQQDAYLARTYIAVPEAGSNYVVPIPVEAVEGDDIVSVVFREVLVDLSGNVLAAGPATAALHAGQAIWEELEDFPSVEDSFPTVVYETDLGVGGQEGGGVVIGPSLPRFGANTAPRWSPTPP